MYGVPILFKNILEEITLQVDAAKNPFGVNQFNNT
jgi:hypothetical protein